MNVMDSEIKREALFKRIEGSKDLPTLPHVIARLNQVLRSPHTNVQEVGEILNSDQSLAAKTLRLVNSAYYGFSGKIQNINRAIVILGFNKVRNLALGIAVVDMFRGRFAERFDFHAFWEHSIATAVITERLAFALNNPEIEDAFVAGLLHDMGLVVTVLNLNDQYEQVSRRKQELPDEKLWVIEREVMGTHHGRIGEFLAEQWKFPPKLGSVMTFHHEPLRARQHRPLVFLAHVADILATAMALGSEGCELVHPIEAEVWSVLELTPAIIDKVYSEALPAYDQAMQFFESANSDE